MFLLCLLKNSLKNFENYLGLLLLINNLNLHNINIQLNVDMHKL